MIKKSSSQKKIITNQQVLVMYLTAIILNTKVMLIKQNVKTFSIKEHLKEITPHLKNLILYPKRSDE